MCPKYKPTAIEGTLKSASAFSLLLLTALLNPAASEAANGTFNKNGSETPYQWGDTANWASSAIASGAGSYAFLSNVNVQNSPLTVNLDTHRSLGHLILGDRDNATRFAVNLTSTGSSVLTFDNAGGTSYLIQASSSSANTISTEISLLNDLRIHNQAALADNSQRLILTGPISAGSAGDKVITVGGLPSIVLNTAPFSSGAYTSAVQFNGGISDGEGKVSLVINNPTAGATIMNGSNSFSGGVTLMDGALELNDKDGLGTGIFTIKGGVVTSASGDRITVNGNGKNMILAGDFTAQNSRVLDLGSTGTITLQKSINVSVINSQFALLGKVEDGGAGHSITKTGAGIFYFSNNSSTFTGGLNVLGGRTIVGNLNSLGTGMLSLNYGGAAGLYNVNVNQHFINRITTDSVGYVGTYAQINAVTADVDLSGHAGLVFGSTNGTMTYNGNLTAHGSKYKLASFSGTTTIFNRALVGEGTEVEVGSAGGATGTVIFNAANTYTGDTTVQGTTTLVLQGANGDIASESAIRLVNNSTFQYSTQGANGATVDNLGALILVGGDATITQNRALDYESSLSFESVTRESGGTVNFTLAGTHATASDNRVYLMGEDPSVAFIDQGLFWDGTQYAAFDSMTHLRGLNYGVDAGTSVVQEGDLASSAAGNHVNLLGNVTSTGDLALETLRFDGARNFTQSANHVLTLSSGGILATGGTSVLSGGSLTSGAEELVIRTALSTDGLFLRSNILSSSTQGITKSGAGVVTLSGTNTYQGNTTVNAGTMRFLGKQALGSGDIVLNGGVLDLRERTYTGDYASNAFETIAVGNNVIVNGTSSLVVSSVDGVMRYQNKTIQFNDLTIGGNQLSITNANGFGVEFAGTTTLSKGTFGDTTFQVVNTRPSPLVPGLTLSGKVTGESRITVRGNGTLHLSNANNDFVGDLWVTQGFLSAANDGALGHGSNKVILIDAAVTSGFRATGTFETDRVIRLGNSVSNRNLLQVTNGNTLTLNTAFEGGAGFVKGDNGTIALNQDNGNWEGTVMILDGVVEIRHDRALGSVEGLTHVGNIGAALHLAGDLNVSEEISIYQHGVNTTGAIYSRSGNSTLNGKINLLGETSLGVAAGSTLTFGSDSKIAIDTTSMPLYTNSDLYRLTLTGEGQGFLKSALDLGNNMLVKQGAGTWTIEENFSNQRDIQILNGTLVVAGANGSLINRSNRVVVGTGTTLVLDNTQAAQNNRLGGMALSLGGELIIRGQANQNHTETLTGALQITGNGHSVMTMDSVGSGKIKVDLIHGTLGLSRFGQGTLLVRGNHLGAGDVAGSSTLTSRVQPALMGTQIAADTLYQGILSWALAEDSASGLGDSFATYDSVRGVRALNSNEQTRDFTQDVNVKTSREQALASPVQIASLQLESGGGVNNVSGETLSLSSGGILAKEGNTGIHGGSLQTAGTTDLVVHALGNLEISSSITQANGGLTKAGTGTLTLSNAANYTGHTSINQGTLKLEGGDQTLLTHADLHLNAGGVLDLNGNNQTFRSIKSLGSAAGEVATLGGKIVNTGAQATLVANFGAHGNFAGTFEGDFNVVRSNTYLLEVTKDWGHQGDTLINGGITRLTNEGQISQSSSLHLSYGSLQLHNNGTTENNNRLADDMNIVMDGAVLSLYGRAGSMTSELVGEVNLNSGMNVLTASGGTNNVNMLPQSSILTLSSFDRNAANAATVNFGQSYNGTSTERLGLNFSGTGSSMNVVVEGGVQNVVNNLVGPWAIYTGFYTYSAMELVGYNQDTGFSSINTSGFAGYDLTAMPSTNAENSNIRHIGNINLAAGGLTINAASIVGNANKLASTLKFANDTDLLTVKGGILAFSIDANNTGISHTVGSAVNEGRITSGYAGHGNLVDLYLWHQNVNFNTALTLNSAIVDNAALNKSLRLVLNSANFGQYPFLLASNQNSYTGGTVVNNTAVRVSGKLGTGGITLNGGNLTQLSGGVIGNQLVTLNGASTMTLTGLNTLKGLHLNNTGGSIPSHSPGISTQFTSFYATRVNVGGDGTLRLDGNIHATSSNVGSTSLIENGILDLNGAHRTIDASAIEWNGDVLAPDQATLNITSTIIASGDFGIRKTGDGWLQLSGDNSFTGSTVVQAGGIILGHDNGLGWGTLVLQDQARLSANHENRNVYNEVQIQGDLHLGTRSNAGGLAFFGNVDWGNAHRTVTVHSQTGVLQDFMGALSGSGGITKAGTGTLALSGYNEGSLDWTGSKAIRIEAGRLSLAYGEVLGDAPAAFVANNIVLDGGTLDATSSFELHANRGIAVGSASGGGRGTFEISNAEAEVTYAGVISDHGSSGGTFVKTGKGALHLSAQHTYSGDTYLTQGSIFLSDEGSISHSRHIHVASEALLDVSQSANQLTRGSQQSLVLSGLVRGDVVLSGSARLDAVSKRGSNSAIFIEGNLNTSSDSFVRFHLQKASFTSLDNFGGFGYGNENYDQYLTNLTLPDYESSRLVITGTFEVENGTTIEVMLGENQPVYGEIYDLADWGTLISSSELMRSSSETELFHFDLPSLAALGLSWDVSHFASRGILVVTPEPGRALLILLALGAFVMRRRR